MGIGIGNRGGVKPRRRGNGLTRIRRPRGIPFHRPSGTYHRRDFMLAEAVKILFTAKGSIHNGTPTVKGVLKGAASIIFDPKGQLSRVTEPSAESQRIQGKTTIHFFQRATLSKSHRMQGVSWIVFAAKMLVHRMKGESDIVFSTSATLSGYKLRGIASFSFSAIINTMKLVKYGLLYNRYAVTDARDIANTGWYVPTFIEISSLYKFADGSADGGGKLKETGLIYWNNPNTGATNDYKFNARGGGQRVYNTGLFTDLKNVGVLWTATANDLITARCWGVQTTTQTILLYTIKENKGGIGVRLLRPATEAEQLLPDGTACDNYIQNDGLSLPTVKIGTQVWTACNLAETKFRNKGIVYGALYNHFAVADPRNIAAVGWDVCSRASINELIAIAGGDLVGGGKLKEKGLLYWASPNTGATNDFGFNLRAASQRTALTFTADRLFNRLWLRDVYSSLPSYAWYLYTYSDKANITTYFQGRLSGLAVRLNRPASGSELLLPDGAACDNYIGNDLKEYRTVKIGSWIWLSENLCETRFRNGDSIQLAPTNDGWGAGSTTPVMCWDNNIEDNSYSDLIPEVTDAAAWAALETAGMCAFDNDWDNVFI